MEKNFFDRKVKPLFGYVGTIGAVFAAIAYIVIVFIMVFGMAVSQAFTQTLVFAVINAGIGLIIMQFLKIQGIDLAKNLEKNKPILEEYNRARAKAKKVHSLRYFWITSVIKDIVVKCVTLAATTMGIIYVVISASQDYVLLLLALVNLIMFACFGILALVKAYDFFNEDHIPFLMEKINERKERERIAAEDLITKEQQERERFIEAEVTRRVEMAKKEYIKQTNDSVCACGGDHILESCVDNCTISNNSESMVLDSDNCNNSILGGTIYACDNPSTCVDCAIKENS